MKKWSALVLGLLFGVVAGRSVRVENAHACDPVCAPDQSVILEVARVDGSVLAKEFWSDVGVGDALLTPHFLLLAVGEGQIELGYEK